jgi:serine/threonine protein kinase
MGSEVLARGDVYSHGILLLELFTGKRPSDDMFKEGLDLHKFATLLCLSKWLMLWIRFYFRK